MDPAWDASGLVDEVRKLLRRAIPLRPPGVHVPLRQ
jgi:hypothetical protein